MATSCSSSLFLTAFKTQVELRIPQVLCGRLSTANLAGQSTGFSQEGPTVVTSMVSTQAQTKVLLQLATTMAWSSSSETHAERAAALSVSEATPSTLSGSSLAELAWTSSCSALADMIRHCSNGSASDRALYNMLMHLMLPQIFFDFSIRIKKLKIEN